MGTIAVVDYDMGNLHSACKGITEAGGTAIVTNVAREIERADAVLLPGVGAFDPAVDHLRSRNLDRPIREAIAAGKPFLGICLGLQILFDGSDEGTEPGLGIVPGRVRRFQPEPGLTVPHMGWNQLALTQPDSALWADLPTDPWMYFVHSYYVDPRDRAARAATTTHGQQTVTAAIHCAALGSGRKNVMAVQFHPEKSASAGLKVLANFVAIANAIPVSC